MPQSGQVWSIVVPGCIFERESLVDHSCETKLEKRYYLVEVKKGNKVLHQNLVIQVNSKPYHEWNVCPVVRFSKTDNTNVNQHVE